MTDRHQTGDSEHTDGARQEDTYPMRQADISKTTRRSIGYPTLGDAVEVCNTLGYPYAVQLWTGSAVRPDEYVIAHGSGDGVGKTVYATIPARAL